LSKGQEKERRRKKEKERRRKKEKEGEKPFLARV